MLNITIKTDKTNFNLNEEFTGKLKIVADSDSEEKPKTCKCKSGYDISDEIGSEGKLPFRFKMSNADGSIEYINKEYYDKLEIQLLDLTNQLANLKKSVSDITNDLIEKVSSL